MGPVVTQQCRPSSAARMLGLHGARGGTATHPTTSSPQAGCRMLSNICRCAALTVLTSRMTAASGVNTAGRLVRAASSRQQMTCRGRAEGEGVPYGPIGHRTSQDTRDAVLLCIHHTATP